jgi:hypothetical protein
MVDIHTNGWTKKILDTKLRDLMQKTMFCTFEDRFSGLVNLLTVRLCFARSGLSCR